MLRFWTLKVVLEGIRAEEARECAKDESLIASLMQSLDNAKKTLELAHVRHQLETQPFAHREHAVFVDADELASVLIDRPELWGVNDMGFFYCTGCANNFNLHGQTFRSYHRLFFRSKRHFMYYLSLGMQPDKIDEMNNVGKKHRAVLCSTCARDREALIKSLQDVLYVSLISAEMPEVWVARAILEKRAACK